MILDGGAMSEALFGVKLPPDEYLRMFYPKAPIPPLDHVVRTATPLDMKIVHGNMIVSCPCGARGGPPTPGGVVFLAIPLVWCIRCQNGATGRGWRPVNIPHETELLPIVAILDCRPKVETRNWSRPETIEDLWRENVEHGDPIPEDKVWRTVLRPIR